jgi:uncharacterized protein with von Willebrand factor type A (vWA) domain
MSKGSTPRPHDKKAFDFNFDRIFGKKEEKKLPQPAKPKKPYNPSWMNV